MRTALHRQEGERKQFRAIFVKLGRKKNYSGHSEETILLKNVIDVENNSVITDHIWFTYTKGFQKINLTEGTQVKFEARIKKYIKGYVNPRYNIDKRTADFKLSHPTKISVGDG